MQHPDQRVILLFRQLPGSEENIQLFLDALRVSVIIFSVFNVKIRLSLLLLFEFSATFFSFLLFVQTQFQQG